MSTFLGAGVWAARADTSRYFREQHVVTVRVCISVPLVKKCSDGCCPPCPVTEQE